MKIDFFLILNFVLLAKCQEDLEQCRASCYDRHHQATPMRGKQGPRGLPGPAGPPGNDFGDRIDGVEGRLVAMETMMRDQENEIRVLRMFKEESTRPGKISFFLFNINFSFISYIICYTDKK